MRVFGLTGGIGSGKSSVGRRFAARGVPVVSADELARAVVAKGSPGLAAVVEAFGTDILAPGRELDRAALAERVFADASARARLEAITHPRIRELAQTRFEGLAAAGEPLACYEIPLLFEAGLEHAYRPIVVVTARPEQQRARAARRDGVSEEAVDARRKAQLPLETKAARADHVIDNSGPLEATLEQADRVLEAICAELGIDAARYPRLITAT